MSGICSGAVIQDWSTPEDILKDVDAVIFDNDGTMVDTMPIHHQAWEYALNKFGMTFPLEKFYAFAGMPLSAIVPRLAEEEGISPVPENDAVTALRKEFHEKRGGRFAGVTAIPPVLQVFHVARKMKLKVAIASGGERKDVLGSLVGAGLIENDTMEAAKQVFDSVVTAEDVEHGKPHPETFLLAAKEMGVAPERCVGLEDADLGLQGLVAGGMRAVDVRHHTDYPLPVELKEILKSRANVS